MPYCLDCQHISAKKSGSALARLGFVGCNVKHAGQTRSLKTDMECDKFVPGRPDLVEKAREWARAIPC